MRIRKHVVLLCAGWLVAGAIQAAPPATELATLNADAMRHHAQRELKRSLSLYKQLLLQDPPQEATPQQRAAALRYAPRLARVTNEYFPLKDFVVVLHPTKPMVAYHLFWEDDIAYPSDSMPCDHEVVWVAYDAASGAVTDVWTYFHGRILRSDEAVADANAHGGRPWVGVEWGFHGSVPRGVIGQDAEVDRVLRRHWELAHHPDANRTVDPLARGWPTQYAGDYEDYLLFNDALDIRPLLERSPLVYRSLWCNATIARYCLRYNFAPKTEWPVE